MFRAAALLSRDKARPPQRSAYCWVGRPLPRYPTPCPAPAPPPPPPRFCYSSPRDRVTHEAGHPGVFHALCENGKLDRKQPFQNSPFRREDAQVTKRPKACQISLGIYARRGGQIGKYDCLENTHSNHWPFRTSAA